LKVSEGEFTFLLVVRLASRFVSRLGAQAIDASPIIATARARVMDSAFLFMD